jgi:hypothetical protein
MQRPTRHAEGAPFLNPSTPHLDARVVQRRRQLPLVRLGLGLRRQAYRQGQHVLQHGARRLVGLRADRNGAIRVRPALIPHDACMGRATSKPPPVPPAHLCVVQRRQQHAPAAEPRAHALLHRVLHVPLACHAQHGGLHLAAGQRVQQVVQHHLLRDPHVRLDLVDDKHDALERPRGGGRAGVGAARPGGRVLARLHGESSQPTADTQGRSPHPLKSDKPRAGRPHPAATPPHLRSCCSISFRKTRLSSYDALREKVQRNVAHSWRAISWNAARSSPCSAPWMRTMPRVGLSGEVLCSRQSAPSTRSSSCGRAGGGEDGVVRGTVGGVDARFAFGCVSPLLAAYSPSFRGSKLTPAACLLQRPNPTAAPPGRPNPRPKLTSVLPLPGSPITSMDTFCPSTTACRSRVFSSCSSGCRASRSGDAAASEDRGSRRRAVRWSIVACLKSAGAAAGAPAASCLAFFDGLGIVVCCACVIHPLGGSKARVPLIWSGANRRLCAR